MQNPGFSKTPAQFLQGIFLAPHTFNDPENPLHGQYVNAQLRYDLYNQAVEKVFLEQQQISNVQFTRSQNEYIKVDQIKECEGEDPPLAYYLTRNKKFREGVEEEMVACEDWEVSLHRNQRLVNKDKYRVRTMQTSTDIFFVKVYPFGLVKQIKNFIFNA